MRRLSILVRVLKGLRLLLGLLRLGLGMLLDRDLGPRKVHRRVVVVVQVEGVEMGCMIIHGRVEMWEVGMSNEDVLRNINTKRP